jgi:hypothetical protein
VSESIVFQGGDRKTTISKNIALWEYRAANRLIAYVTTYVRDYRKIVKPLTYNLKKSGQLNPNIFKKINLRYIGEEAEHMPTGLTRYTKQFEIIKPDKHQGGKS